MREWWPLLLTALAGAVLHGVFESLRDLGWLTGSMLIALSLTVYALLVYALISRLRVTQASSGASAS